MGKAFQSVAFPDSFFRSGIEANDYDSTPLVFSQAQRATGNSETMISQQKSIGTNGFELGIPNSNGSAASNNQTVGYIALQRRTTNPSPTPWGNYASSTTTANASYNLAPGSSPVVIAGLQTTSEDDPVTIRRSGVTTSGAQFALQEAGSGPHASETIGYLAFPGSITLLGQTLETDKLTVYVWEGQNEVLRLIDADGNGDEPMRLMNRYLYGDTVDMLLAEEDFVSPLSGLSYAPALDSAYSFVPGNNYWPLSDHLGSIRDVVDSNGTVRMHVVYDEFGNRVEEAYYRGTERVGSDSDYAIDALFGYTGRDWDAETGLQYNRARWYDSTTGRWLSQDPIGFAAGDANLYRYVGNGPVDSTDPSGLEDPQLGPDSSRQGTQVEKAPSFGGAIVRPGDQLPNNGTGLPNILSSFPQNIQDELHRQIADALTNAPKLWGYVESFESYYDWIPGVNPEIEGQSDGPCERWTTGVHQYLSKNNDKSYIVYNHVQWTIDGGTIWSGHHGIRIEVYDPVTVNGAPNTWKLLGVIYIDNGVLGGSDHYFGEEDIPISYVSETPGHCSNGKPANNRTLKREIPPLPKRNPLPRGPVIG